MKVILYMATTINGYVAKTDDNTDWVSATDWDNFRSLIKQTGIIVMGRRTYEHSGDDFPYKGAINLIMTHNKKLLKESKYVIFTNKTPKEIIQFAKKKKFKELLVIGGGQTNGLFLKEKLLDEIILSVHPIAFGKGIKLFGDTDAEFPLKLLAIKKLKEGIVQLRYKVIKH